MMIKTDSIARFGAAALIALVPQQSLANDVLCAKLGDLAERVMTLRQQDKPMSTVMTEVAGAVSEPSANKVVREMIVAAYSEPSWSSDENKVRAAAEFRNANEVLCYKAFNSN